MRLDFTVIGPAVDLASRIEALTRDLGRRTLVSEGFKTLHGGPFDDLVYFEIKGIAAKHGVCAPLP